MKGHVFACTGVTFWRQKSLDEPPASAIYNLLELIALFVIIIETTA